MMKTYKRILLNDEEAETKICSLSVDDFWDLTEMIPANTENNIPYKLHFKPYKDNKGVMIQYVVDPVSKCKYAIVSGQKIHNVCETIYKKVKHFNTKDIFNNWDNSNSDKEKISSTLKIGVIAPFLYDKNF